MLCAFYFLLIICYNIIINKKIKNKYMSNIDQLMQDRLNKIDNIEAYPAECNRDISNLDFINTFDELIKINKQVTIAGRIMSKRGQGKLIFMDIYDGTEKVQGLAKLPESEESVLQYIDNHLDVADFVEIVGVPLLSKTGQKSVLINSIRLISKALLPMPDIWHGIENEELRLRKRYLEILTNSDLRDMIEKKSIFWKTVREFFDKNGFLEVETPTIETTTGGAAARPFKTHHNDFDIEVYMRICIGELWQKRLMAAGIPKTFEIGRAYRNEGSSPNHLQEFTNCEFYMAYSDYRDGMALVREMYREIAKKVFNKTKFETRGHIFDLSDDWIEIDYKSEVKKQTGIDLDRTTLEEMANKLKELNVRYDGYNLDRLTDTLWKYCRKNISGPGFLINHPLYMTPLAKSNSDGKTAQAFQVIIGGAEVGNGYSELNDPRIQRKNFEEQQKLLENGDEEAMMPDWEFVDMLEHGMPPACGFGFGDRLFAFLLDKPIRETVTFPLIKKKD